METTKITGTAASTRSTKRLHLSSLSWVSSLDLLGILSFGVFFFCVCFVRKEMTRNGRTFVCLLVFTESGVWFALHVYNSFTSSNVRCLCRAPTAIVPPVDPPSRNVLSSNPTSSLSFHCPSWGRPEPSPPPPSTASSPPRSCTWDRSPKPTKSPCRSPLRHSPNPPLSSAPLFPCHTILLTINSLFFSLYCFSIISIASDPFFSCSECSFGYGTWATESQWANHGANKMKSRVCSHL